MDLLEDNIAQTSEGFFFAKFHVKEYRLYKLKSNVGWKDCMPTQIGEMVLQIVQGQRIGYSPPFSFAFGLWLQRHDLLNQIYNFQP